MSSSIRRPEFTVQVRAGADAVIRYSANHLCYAVVEGKYVMCFYSSGTLVCVPVDDVLDIKFDPRGATWCGQCDQPMTTWPTDDPSFGPECSGPAFCPPLKT